MKFMKKISNLSFKAKVYILSSFVCLLIIIVASIFFQTYSEPHISLAPTNDYLGSRIEADTVYINDLTNDWYYYYSMNDVKDIYNNTVNYSSSNLKKVTINYYGHAAGVTTCASNDYDNCGYVSLSEKQYKYVYYKYYPIENGSINIELIDNPFTLRPTDKAFGGWTSSVGTISTNSKTHVQTLRVTAGSGDLTIDIYPNWIAANVVYVKGADGDDNFDGTSPYYAVASWSKAFQLLESRSTNASDREQNIIVVTGGIDHVPNYSRSYTHTYNYNVTYHDNTSFTTAPVIIEYVNGANRYALTDNNGNIASTRLLTDEEPTGNIKWIISPVSGGYTIQNATTSRYVSYVQNGRNATLTLNNTPTVWIYDNNNRRFYAELSYTFEAHDFTTNDSFNESTNYLITNSGPNNINAMTISGNGIANSSYTPTTRYDGGIDNNAIFSITNNGSGYLIKNSNTGKYISTVVTGNNVELANNTATTDALWQYDSANQSFYRNIEIPIPITVTYTPSTTFNVNDEYLLANTNTNNAYVINSDGTRLQLSTSSIPSTAMWLIEAVPGGYTLKNTSTNEYLNYTGSNGNFTLTSSTTPRTWQYDTANRSFYVVESTITSTTVTYSWNNGITDGETYILSQGTNNNSYALNSNLGRTQLSGTTEPADAVKWTFRSVTGGYTIQNVATGQYLGNNGNNLRMVDNPTTWTYDATNRRLSINRRYLRYSGNPGSWSLSNTNYSVNFGTYTVTNQTRNDNYSLYYTNNNWTLNSTNRTRLYFTKYTSTPPTEIRTYRISYNNAWGVSTTTSNATRLGFTTYNSYTTTDDFPFYIRHNNNNFEMSTNNANSSLNFATYDIDRRIATTNTGTNANNNYYTASTNIAVTITSLYNATDYRNDATLTFTTNGRRNFLVRNDLQLENLRISSNGYSTINDDTTSTSETGNMSYLEGSYFNVRIGRGMTPDSWTNTTATTFGFIYGGSSSASKGSTSNQNNEFRFVIESGRYSGAMALRSANDGTYNAIRVADRIRDYYGTMEYILGNDYERANKDNDKLQIYYRTTTSNNYGVNGRTDNINLPAYLVKVKSGTIGTYFFDLEERAINGTLGRDEDLDDAYSSGLYLGGLTVNTSSTTGDLSARVLIVEGGKISNIIGGLRLDSSKAAVNTKIYVKDGEISNIVGGAGRSTTYGDRYISVTGGHVLYSISGGSNGQSTTGGSGQTGELVGNSYVYVGGTAIVGIEDNFDQLYGVSRGSVLGAGNGNATVDEAGQVDKSNIFIGGEAKIYGNVYGGGNFGTITNSVNITIDGGTIYNNVYGGPNQNDVGTVTVTKNNNASEVSYTDSQTFTAGEYYLINRTVSGTRNLLNENNGNVNNVTGSNTVAPNNSSNWTIAAVSGGYTIRNRASNRYLTTSEALTVPQLNLESSSANGIWKFDSTNHSFHKEESVITSATVNYNFANSFTSGNSYLISNGNSSTGNVLNGTNNLRLTTTSIPEDTAMWTITSSGSGYTIQNSNGDYLGYTRSGTFTYTYNLSLSSTATVWTYDTANRAFYISLSGGWLSGDSNYYLRFNNNAWSLSTTRTALYFGTYTYTATRETHEYYLAFDNTWKLTTTNTNINSLTFSTYKIRTIVGYNVSNQRNGDVTITMNSGEIKNALYGGSCSKGNVAGLVKININGGKIGTIQTGEETLDYSNIPSVYGGGYGVDTTVVKGVELKIKETEKDVEIAGTVYGGSALGGVVGDISVEIEDTNNVNTLNIYGDMYCGSMGSDTNATTGVIVGSCDIKVLGGNYPGKVFGGNNANGSATGNINVTIGGTGNNTTIDTVFGGGNEADSLASNVKVYVKSNSDLVNVYGGGNEASVPVTYLYLQGGNVTNAYGGSNKAGATTTNVSLEGSNASMIFGGSNTSGDITTTNVTTTSGTAENVFGGNNLGGSVANTNVTINGGTITNVYGGGEQTDVTNIANVTLNGEVTNLFGGSDSNGTVNESNIVINSGVADNVYGGNNLGGTATTTNIAVNGCDIGTIYGGGKKASSTTSTINFDHGEVDKIFGGGSEAGVVTTNINLNKGDIGYVFGGSDKSGSVTTSNINNYAGTTTSGSLEIDKLYGGNNSGGVTTNSRINLTSGTIGEVYGGGDKAVTGNAIVNLNGITITDNYFGGGNEASITTVTSTLDNCTIGSSSSNGNIYGGGNAAKVDSALTLNILNNTTVYGNIYGGGNDGDVDGLVTLDLDNTEVIGTIFGGGNAADINANVIITADSLTATNYYGGGNEGAVQGIVTSTLTDSTITNNIYGGGNQGSVGSNGNTDTIVDVLTMTNVDTCNVFGGGNAAGVNGSVSLIITDSAISCDVYGAGNGVTSVVSDDATGELNPAKVYGNTNVKVLNGTTVDGNIYGGGNLGFVTGNTNVELSESSVDNSIYGGGNAARVKNNTELRVHDATIGDSVYAGGNGVKAIVEGSTILNVDGSTNVTHHVFGGGNAAATGLSSTNNSTGVVNIVGATIGGNVYGGANTSVLYGTATVKIGENAVNNSDLTSGNISIAGTVFGGGEANASGSAIYDYSFISVTNGIDIFIDATNHSIFAIDGSIFGSGNASSTTGYSHINLKNYGTSSSVKKNISIQRADTVILDNSYVMLSGATDRTNEYSDVLFSLSRIDELKLKNNSSLYLKTGANLLKKFSSLVDINGTEVKEVVTIDDENKTVTKNVDNRLYMLQGKNLNVATNENITSYGIVNGMTFFGMFNQSGNAEPVTAIYSPTYDYGDNAIGGDAYYFSDGSYVLGLHMNSHNIEADGFYSNDLVSEDGTELKTFFIEPTPADTDYYMWVVGKQVVSYEINLSASKYSTLGVEELSLINYSNPNTKFSILGFNYDGLQPGVSLHPSNEIPRIAPSTTEADNNLALSMKTGQSGWITIGNTEFVSNSTRPISGTTFYQKENSTDAPSFLFYLYHSKNLGTTGDLGTVTISLSVITPIDDLTNSVERINIVVNLSRRLYTTNDYEATMTTGKQYMMFASSNVNITTTSSLSAYYSLYMDATQTPFRPGDYRTLVSSYVLPENTKITMIDYFDEDMPVYYYYVVTAADVIAAQNEYAINNEVTYPLSKFVKMGTVSSNTYYNDATQNALYYNPTDETILEEFVFIVDFKESGITANQLDNSLLIERRSSDNHTVVAVLGIEQANMHYNLYHDRDAIIEIDGNIDRIDFYNGNNIDLNINTNFIQQKVSGNTIIDTNYYDQRLGIKITFFDEYGNQLTSSNLMGIYFENDGQNYYPRDNGETRINIAERVANIASRIKIHAETSSLAGGNYKMVIESFGSADGIYYGLESSDTMELNIKVMETLYGLKITIPETGLFWNKLTGKNTINSNALIMRVQYDSELENPNLRIKVYRRKYDSIYSTEYNLVDFADYFSNSFDPASNNKEYYLERNPVSNVNYYLYLKDNLISGTYKLEVSLYDNNTFIGEVYQYILIK